MLDVLKHVHQALCGVGGVDVQRMIALRKVRAQATPGQGVTLLLRNGITLALEPSQYLTHKLVRHGCFDPAVAEAAVRLSVPGGLHVDVGANVGYMSALMAGVAGGAGRVVAFEPMPRTRSRLQENVRRVNEALGALVVEARPEALGAREGMATLAVPSNVEQCDGLVSVRHEATAGDGIQVTVRRLDDLIGPDAHLDLVKIDVEGGELAVLTGAQGLIESGRMQTVIFEEHERFPGAAARFLLDRSYRIWRLHHRGPLGVLGPRLCIPDRRSGFRCPPGFEPDPNYVATLDPVRVSRSMRGIAWRCA